jgi:outer membrane lipoprotein-sorting protein
MPKAIKPHGLFFCAVLGAKAGQVDEWWKYADAQMRGDKSTSEITMTIETPSWTRTLEIESEVEGKDHALSTIKAPAKEKGIRTLRIGGNMWNYFPKLKRKVAVSSSMLLASWMGSDFTNDDILKASSMSADYSHAFGPDEKLGKDPMRVIVNTDCLPRESRYYDKEGTLKRVLSFSDVKTFDGHKVPTRWEMRPQDDKTKKTILEYKKMNFNPKFKPGHFSQQNLTDS